MFDSLAHDINRSHLVLQTLDGRRLATVRFRSFNALKRWAEAHGFEVFERNGTRYLRSGALVLEAVRE